MRQELAEAEAAEAFITENPEKHELTDQEEQFEFYNAKNWYVECDVCGNNDFGIKKCGCIEYIQKCSFTEFRREEHQTTMENGLNIWMRPWIINDVPIKVLLPRV
jgi:hypothetical protein